MAPNTMIVLRPILISGAFAANMQVSLENDGPVTFILAEGFISDARFLRCLIRPRLHRYSI